MKGLMMVMKVVIMTKVSNHCSVFGLAYGDIACEGDSDGTQ